MARTGGLVSGPKPLSYNSSERERVTGIEPAPVVSEVDAGGVGTDARNGSWSLVAFGAVGYMVIGLGTCRGFSPVIFK